MTAREAIRVAAAADGLLGQRRALGRVSASQRTTAAASPGRGARRRTASQAGLGFGADAVGARCPTRSARAAGGADLVKITRGVASARLGDTHRHQGIATDRVAAAGASVAIGRLVTGGDGNEHRLSGLLRAGLHLRLQRTELKITDLAWPERDARRTDGSFVGPDTARFAARRAGARATGEPFGIRDDRRCTGRRPGRTRSRRGKARTRQGDQRRRRGCDRGGSRGAWDRASRLRGGRSDGRGLASRQEPREGEGAQSEGRDHGHKTPAFEPGVYSNGRGCCGLRWWPLVGRIL